ncbi:hypothetical protein [Streptomyces sp. WAC06614]|uniref:hypothetical protein n=1 Tax=Streptomyces sp. WAC06614 TaxID=2487416 RepID=UPI000F79FA1D|nr:hypothetical protein [Streptomyces sp. WAC06614]RSS61479.1 hypothetical protein EF918_31810 [Streptomyces sp. WAC06614]
MSIRKHLVSAATVAGALASLSVLAVAPAQAAGVDKYKSVDCGHSARVWYRDYGQQTMLREITFDNIGDKFSVVNVYWRADDGKTTIQEYTLTPGWSKISDSQTKDVAVAKSRKPYVKFMFKSLLGGTCTRYVDLN